MTESIPRRRAAVAMSRSALALLLMAAQPASACELDGLSHGYGPMSALFAGAHRYQSLNGLEDEEAPPEAPPPAPTDAAPPPGDATGSPDAAPPPAPQRSFVAWAKAKPKAPGGEDEPAAWARVPASGARESADAKPESAER